MTATQIIVAVVAVVVVAAIAYVILKQQRSKALRSRIGTRAEGLDIRPLAPDERSRYAARWKTVQARSVDDPAASIGDADRLVAEVMSTRGYPMADFEQRATDISVSHPEVVEHYRTARDVAQLHRQRPVSTEELRTAFRHYRELFASLLEAEAGQTEGAIADEPTAIR
jgi:predicted nucleic acid-binding protein